MIVEFGTWPVIVWCALAGWNVSAGFSHTVQREGTQVMDGVRTSIRCSHCLVGGSFAFLFFATDESMGGIEHLRSEQQVIATQ